MLSYRRVKKEEIESLAKWTAESFLSYPYFALCFRRKEESDEEYLMFLEKYLAIAIRVLYEKGVCFVAEEDGKTLVMSIMMNNRTTKIRDEDFIKAGLLDIEEFNDEDFRYEADRIDGESFADIMRFYPNSWYAELLAVRTGYKGKGLGRKMLEECLIPFVKEQGGKEFTLITNTEKNVEFYEKRGFQLFAIAILKKDQKELKNYSLVMKF